MIFLSEAFTRPKMMRYLAKAGFSQSYTYFTWRNTAQELQEYLTELTTTETREYLRPNFFANTPDILHEYLQTGGRPAFEVRLILAATLSASYGIYSGFELCENVSMQPGSEEYLHSEKYEIRAARLEPAGPPQRAHRPREPDQARAASAAVQQHACVPRHGQSGVALVQQDTAAGPAKAGHRTLRAIRRAKSG